MRSPLEGGRICEEFSPGYYGICAVGGLLSAGTTHLAITPLDVVKVNMQVNPVKYYSISKCFTTILREQGPSAFWRGRGGKFFGYGIQGACRFGLYEYFKKFYSNLLVDHNRSSIFFISSASAEVIANVALCPFEAVKVRVQAQRQFAKGLIDGFPKAICNGRAFWVNPVKYYSISKCFTTILREQGPSAFWRGRGGKFFGYGIQGACRFGLYEYFKKFYSNLLVDHNRSSIFFISSASAEVIANVALCPFEAVKVRVQAQRQFAKGLIDGFPKLYATEGLFGFYRGLVPLLGRNLPFSMVMFSTFEYSVNFLYRNVIQRRKEECSKVQQLGVTCLAGYAAGSVGSIISNPADNIVASLYNRKASSLKLAVKKIGLVNLFTRSLPIRIMLVGPAVTLQWFFYDTIKVLSGLPTSGEVRTHVEETKTSRARQN